MIRRYYKSRSRLKMYGIYKNGIMVGNFMGENCRSALYQFCRYNNVDVVRGYSLGLCGMPSARCITGYSYKRLCGRVGRCIPRYFAETNIGILEVIKIQ